jgi:hypothetical protein
MTVEVQLCCEGRVEVALAQEVVHRGNVILLMPGDRETRFLTTAWGRGLRGRLDQATSRSRAERVASARELKVEGV